MGSTAVRNVSVGLVFLGGLAILGVSTLALSSVGLFQDIQALEVRFPNVDNLREGDDVLLHGFRVGEVSSIRFEPSAPAETPIAVRCSVRGDVVPTIRPGTRFTIQSASTLGGRYVAIEPPAPGAPPPEGAPPAGGPYVGEAPGDLFRQLEDLVETNQKSITEAIDSIRAIVQDIDAGRGLIGQLIQDPVLASNFDGAISELREILRAIGAGEGTIGALVKDQEMRDRVVLAVDDLADVIAGLKKDEGTVGYLLNNVEARDRVARAIEDLSGVVADVRGGNGLATRLISDSKLADSIEGAASQLQEVVDKVNSGSGTVGQLVNNPRAWEELMKILVLAREAVEDLREQAPISTFVNVLFSAF